MVNKNKTLLSYFVIAVFGLVLLYLGTDGFTAYTSEKARVNQLKEETPMFPEVTLEDHAGRVYPFSEFEGKYVFITFFYSMCGTVCPELEKNMAEVYEMLPEDVVEEGIQFLSISFDPERDTPEVLDTYREWLGSDGETWRMARIPDQKELDELLDRFGVIVIPDEYGNFAHNSAFYLVDPDGRLVEVMDYQETREAAATVMEIMEEGEEK
ncbi:SCO family protein [Thalassobacillus devorans]|uniref:SCO family protein n=1 Tax=Thalassobacillus devorans TaxID=279813 RepID=UPI00048A76FC|nr:SCO family protein [Thalassobacillus devorans]